MYCSEAQQYNYNNFSDLFGVNNASRIRKAIQEEVSSFNNVPNYSNNTSKGVKSLRGLDKAVAIIDSIIYNLHASISRAKLELKEWDTLPKSYSKSYSVLVCHKTEKEDTMKFTSITKVCLLKIGNDFDTNDFFERQILKE